MRQEFSRRTKLQAWDRCGGQCEECGRALRPGDRIEYDHRIPCEFGGGNTLDNCQVLCGWCHGAKTSTADAPAIAKARSVRARHVNADDPHKQKIPGSRGTKFKRKVGGGTVLRDQEE